MTQDLEDISLKRATIQRWPIALAVMAALLLATSGCAGGARAASWTGLTIAGDTLYAADLEQARARVAALEAKLRAAGAQEDQDGNFSHDEDDNWPGKVKGVLRHVTTSPALVPDSLKTEVADDGSSVRVAFALTL